MADDTTRHASLTLGRAQARIGDVPYAVTMRIDGHAIVADEPEALGGHNAGPRPFGLLLGALGACTLMTLRIWLRIEQCRVVDRASSHVRQVSDDGHSCRGGAGSARTP